MTVNVVTAPGEVPFKVLGPLEVFGPLGRIHIPKWRQHAILSTLLIEANRVVNVDALIDAAWSEEPPTTARSQIHICVSTLRRKFHQARMEVPFVTQPSGYSIEIPEDQFDLHIFRVRTARAETALRTGRTDDAVRLFRSALTLWRGPALGGVCHTLQHKASRLNEWRLTVQESCFGAELALGRHHELVAELGEFVAQYPLRDRPRGQLMLALHRCGRTPEALDTYRTGRDLLISELGLEPSDELRQLECAILARDPRLLFTADPDPDGCRPAGLPHSEWPAGWPGHQRVGLRRPQERRGAVEPAEPDDERAGVLPGERQAAPDFAAKQSSRRRTPSRPAGPSRIRRGSRKS